MQFHPIFILYLSAFAIAVLMFFWSRHLPKNSGSRIWGLVMFFCAIWSAGDGLETLVTDISLKLICIRISYIGVIGTAVFWSLFILIYSGNEQILTRRVRWIFSVIPVITLVSVITLSHHSLFYKSVTLGQTNGFFSLSLTYGPVFIIWAVFAYTAICSSGVLLIQAALRFPPYFHGQILMLVVAGILPLVSNFLYITGNNFMAPFDPSAPAFAVSGILVGLSFRHYRFMNVMPIARDQVFELLGSGVIIMDSKGIVIEVNPAVEKLMNVSKHQIIGRSVRDTILDQLNLPDSPREEVKKIQSLSGLGMTFELQLTPFTDPSGSILGHILLLYDITALKKSEQKLVQAYDQLKHIAATDPLTGLFNRRSFFNLTKEEMARSKRQSTCFSLLIIDLDHFKTVNDTNGHLKGDQILAETGALLHNLSRTGELIGRYGGDEFIVLSYGADQNEALALAERYRNEIPPNLGKGSYIDHTITLSIGIETFEKSGKKESISLETLLERADQALYQSKQKGRNQTSVWAP